MRIGLLVALIACSGKPSEDAAPPEPVPTSKPAPPAPTKKPPEKVTSPLPEKGPHPDYPTPVAAGTDKIFLIEEPDRGPLPPLDFPYPASTDGTPYAHCDDGTMMPICAGTAVKTGIWYALAKTKTATVVTKHRGTLAEEVQVYLYEGGKLKQVVMFDAYRRLDHAMLFSAATRYTMRARNGANRLRGCGAMELELDKQGRLARRRCLQWNGEPMSNTNGVASFAFTRDARGFIVEERRFGIDGKPVAAADRVHRLSYELDAAGRDALLEHFGTDDKPTADHRGCHAYRHDRDAGGSITRTTCLGADAKPSNDSRAIAWQEFRYDARGCQVAIRNVSLAGKAPRDPSVDYVVDERCAVLSHTCVNAKGDRVACATGDPARYDFKRDDFGQAVSVAHFEPDGTAGKHPSWGAFEIRSEFDDRGNATGVTCHDAFGKAVECNGFGFARQRSTFDDAGREVSRVFFDVEGNPATNAGAHTRKLLYDNYDHLFESRGYDVAGKVFETLGMAVRRDLYDVEHRKFAVILLDKVGKPARYTGCFGGATCPDAWHAARIVRRADGTVDKNQFFDEKGQLVDTKDCSKVRCFR